MKTMAITSDSYVNVSVQEKIGYWLGDMASNLSVVVLQQNACRSGENSSQGCYGRLLASLKGV